MVDALKFFNTIPPIEDFSNRNEEDLPRRHLAMGEGELVEYLLANGGECNGELIAHFFATLFSPLPKIIDRKLALFLGVFL